MTTLDEQTEQGKALAVQPESMPVARPGELLSAIVELARDPNFDVAKLEALAGLQERMEDRQAARMFAEALQRAQAEIPPISKHGTVELGAGKGSYAFAKWEDMDKVLRPIMERHGFTLTFDAVAKEGGGAVVTGTLTHAAGHSKSSSKAMGSTLSYGRRYTAEMLFNITRKGEDDDAVAGGREFITEAQEAELFTLLKATNTEPTRFLDMMVSGIHHLNEIEEKDFARLRNALLAKKSQQEKKGA